MKRNVDGNIVKFKARLVAQGFKQIVGVDYLETFSLVMRRRCLRILFAVAIEKEIQQIDIISAYLNNPLDIPVYMESPYLRRKKGDIKIMSANWKSRYIV